MSVSGSNLQEVISEWIQDTQPIDEKFTQKFSLE